MILSIYSRYYGLETIEAHGRIGLVQRPAVRASKEGLVHTLVGGETLDELAARYYGREELWWRIADANPARFPLDWGAGDELLIPPIATATRTPRV